MYDMPGNTMVTYLSNPMFEANNFSDLPVSMLRDEIEKFKKKNGKQVAPETDALKFYFLNHAFHILKTKFNALEPLDADMTKVAEKHIQITNEVAKRLFFYSVIIAVEEARFIPPQAQKFYDHLRGRYGDEFHDYVKNNFGAGRSYGEGSLTSFGNLNMTCGDFCSAMVSVFAFGNWQHGFGGKGWVPIASLVAETVQGRMSFEGMADQAFSLCHNNGSMFNKGKFYNCYTQFIYGVLDIQDSGQIPQWISSNLSSNFVDAELKEVFDLMKKRFPDEMTGKVDQSLLKNSSAKREKKAQALQKHNMATWNNQQNQPAQLTNQEKAQAKQNQLDNVLLKGFKIPGM